MSERTCSIDGCDNGGKLRHTWCTQHYERWRRNGDPLVISRVLASERGCAVKDCERPHHAHGWCELHYRRWRTLGDPFADLPLRSPEDPSHRFWSKVVDDPNGCWLWTGTMTSGGYGMIHVGGRGGRTFRAHRWAYEYLIGAIPDGLVLDHLCMVKRCVNPYHLEPVPQAVNVRRAAQAP